MIERHQRVASLRCFGDSRELLNFERLCSLLVNTQQSTIHSVVYNAVFLQQEEDKVHDCPVFTCLSQA
ncbi:hypothetical protein Q31a_14760 [Aureliella helgolandensis]|uniref:Uncharacterized protein n=1 Tax=Aureliella helgolandensis TaxID=2527968 RepID=A0A518G3L0_9BACT|nr:hypothetical protein Q31a_14760 [Aureliella helgolandensis]